jgi:YHS domain-containing protein
MKKEWSIVSGKLKSKKTLFIFKLTFLQFFLNLYEFLTGQYCFHLLKLALRAKRALMNRDLPRIKADIKDIVCGMEVSSHSKYHHHYGNNRYYFCSESCLGKFIDNPERYLAERPSIPKAESEEPVVYTCPMHPEVRQSSPGSYTEGENIPGAWGIGAPIFNATGKVEAVLSIVGIINPQTKPPITEYSTLLLEATSDISKKMGYHKTSGKKC